MKKGVLVALGLAGLLATAAVLAASGGKASVIAVYPLVGDYAQVSTNQTPPTEEQCFTVNFSQTVPNSGRRCFRPQAIYSAYDLQPLYDRGLNGSGTRSRSSTRTAATRWRAT